MALYAEGLWGHLKWPAFFFLFTENSDVHMVSRLHISMPEVWNMKQDNSILLLLLLYHKFYGYVGVKHK